MSTFQNKKAEVVFFNTFAGGGYDVFTDAGYHRILREFERLVRPQPREVLFDLGCGSGAFSKRVLPYGLRVCGIDISDACIQYARKDVPEATFEIGDIERLPYQDGVCDIVVFSGVLHHFSDFRNTVREAFRVLRPGGRIFAYDPNVRNPFMWLYRDKRSPFRSSKGVTENEHPLSEKEIIRVLEECRFINVMSYGISGVSFGYVESGLVRFLLPLYNSLDSLLDKTPLAKQLGAFLTSYAEKPYS